MVVFICTPKKEEATLIKKRIERFSIKSQTALSPVVFTSGIEAAATNAKAEIAVIDTSLKDIDCIALGKILIEKAHYTRLIYLSSDYKALDEALNIGTVRFLKRPFDERRFLNGIETAIRQINDKTVYFSLRDGDTYTRVCKDEIIYIEIENRKTKIVTKNKTFYSLRPMVFWREQLQGSDFISPHKSFLINMCYITDYKRNRLTVLSGIYQIPIARAKGTEFHKHYLSLDTSAR